MRSIRNLRDYSAGLPLLADDIVEFHASRLILLLALVGAGGSIKGLTKLAKLDFFVRYPDFFAAVLANSQQSVPFSDGFTESSMIRYHYGPWDPRYYHVLAYLESKGLVKIDKVDGKAFQFTLTDLGQEIASKFAADPNFESLVEHMAKVKKTLGSKTGSSLKKLIYATFDKEVTQLPLGEIIS